MVQGIIVLHVKIYNIASGPNLFTLFKVYILQLYLFVSATRGEVGSGAAALRLYLTKEYLAVASEAESWIKRK